MADRPAGLLPTGCLTDAGLASVRTSVPGQAPPELAAHLARCSSCQRRLLAAGGPGALDSVRAGAPRKKAPPVWRTAVVMIAAILLVLAAVVTVSRMSGP